MLHEAIGAEEEIERQQADSDAWHVLDTLRKTSEDERLLISTMLLEGCPAELPENVHMSLNLLKRETGFSKPKLMRLLESLSPLGFVIRLREGHEHDEDELSDHEKFVVMEWHNMTEEWGNNATLTAREVLRLAIDGYCDDCANHVMRILDFSQLSSATFTPEEPHVEQAS